MTKDINPDKFEKATGLNISHDRHDESFGFQITPDSGSSNPAPTDQTPPAQENSDGKK